MKAALMRLGVLVGVFLLIISDSAFGIQFKLNGMSTKCLSEDANVKDHLLGRFASYPEMVTDIQLRVYNPVNDLIFSKSGVSSSKFAIPVSNGGEHQFCFTNTGNMDKTIMIEVESSMNKKQLEDIAKKEHLKPLEIELRNIETMVNEFLKNLDYMKTREEAMRDTNESTNARVMWMSVLSMITLVGLGIWQLVFLKNFFVSKKLI